LVFRQIGADLGDDADRVLADHGDNGFFHFNLSFIWGLPKTFSRAFRVQVSSYKENRRGVLVAR
jgi:hypothetical protein